MNMIQLQYLVDVGELGSFTEAARKNHITVPAISISISQLETELEATLFSRSRKGVFPTNVGKKVIQQAISILKLADKMKQDISQSKTMNHGNIVIATIPGMVTQIVKTTLEFRKNHPFMNVQMVEGDPAAVINHVKNGHADIGFLSFGTTNHEEALNWEPIMRDEAVLVVHKNSALRFKNSITGDDIKDETIVLYNSPAIIKIAESLYSGDLSERIALTSNNTDAILQMVLHGNAITIATNYVIHSLPEHLRNEVVTLSIKHVRPDPSYLWRVTRKDGEVSVMAEQFTEHLLTDIK